MKFDNLRLVVYNNITRHPHTTGYAENVQLDYTDYNSTPAFSEIHP